MNQHELLHLLENDARLTPMDLADILNEDVDDIKQEIKQLEQDQIICGYHTVINYNKAMRDEKVLGLYRSQLYPTRNRGYDKQRLVSQLSRSRYNVFIKW